MKKLKFIIIFCICNFLNNANAQWLPTPEICMVTANENNHNVIVWKCYDSYNDDCDYCDSIIGYNVLRNCYGTYCHIASINSKDVNSWVDTISNIVVSAYGYRVQAFSNNDLSSMTTAHITMRLTVSKANNNQWNLKWNSYKGIDYNTIKIYRSNDWNTGIWEQVGTVSGTALTFTDTFIPTKDTVYYYVEIPFSENCATELGFNSIRSNIATNFDPVNFIENFESSEISVYPNPTNGQITVQTERTPSPQNIQIYDISGRIVETQLIASLRNENENNITIDISHLQQGIYFLKIENKITKIIKN